MTFYVESETDDMPDFDVEELLRKVILEVLDTEQCPYEASVSLLLTDDEAIREINREQRGKDAVTDVLSFPAFEYPKPADFEAVEQYDDCFDPDTGELLLGDMVISINCAKRQAESYGHTLYREIAFLIAHSVLHLIGYDHMEPDEEKVMFEKQDRILERLRITRD